MPKTAKHGKRSSGSTAHTANLNMSRYSQFDSGDEDGYGVRCVDFRAFIFGVEITEHCTGSISIPRAGRDGDGTCSFTLDNNYDKFVMRSANFNYSKDWQENSFTANTWDDALLKIGSTNRDVVDGSNFISPYTDDQSDFGRFLYSEHAKYAIYKRKVAANIKARKAYEKLLASSQSTDFAPLVDMYKLHVGDPIISRLDHVRVWILDPMLDPAEVGSGDPNAPSTLRWMPGFTGFVDTITKDTDVLTGKSTLSIQCCDIRTILKRKRALVNSTAAEGNLLVNPNASAKGLFADINLGNLAATSNDLASLNFKDILSKIFCKTASVDDDRKYGATPGAPDTTVKPVLSPAASDALQTSIKQYGGSVSSAASSAASSATSTASTGTSAEAQANMNASTTLMQTFLQAGNWASIPSTIAKIRGDSSGDENAENSATYGVGLYTLGHYFQFPDMTNLTDAQKRKKCGDFMDDWCALTVFGVNRTWYSDAAVTAISKQSYPGGKYSCYKGFVHFLEPAKGTGIQQYMDSQLIQGMGVDREYQSVYQIFTDICDRIDYQFQVNGMGDIMFEPPFYDLLPQDLGGEWKYVHSVGNSVRSSTVNDDTESNPCTCLKVTGGLQSVNAPEVSDEKLKNLEYTIWVKSDSMTEKYGFVEEDLPCPFVTAVTSGQSMPDTDSAKLAIYGIIEFTKKMAAMSQLQIDAAYNPFLYPNRPYLAFYERRVGTITSSTITLEIGSSASSSVEVSMIRQFDDTGVCTNLTGFRHTPFSLMNTDETLASLTSLTGTWTEIRSKCGVELFKSDPSTGGLTKVGATGGLSGLPRTSEVSSALGDLCKHHGLTPNLVCGVMMLESQGSSTAANNDKAGNSACGLFQMTKATYITTKAYATKKHLSWPVGSVTVDTSSAKAFQTTFTSAYTAAQQLKIWDIYLSCCESITKTKVDTLEKLCASQNGVGVLKQVASGQTISTEFLNYRATVAANSNSSAANSFSSSVTAASSSAVSSSVSTTSSAMSHLLGTGSKVSR